MNPVHFLRADRHRVASICLAPAHHHPTTARNRCTRASVARIRSKPPLQRSCYPQLKPKIVPALGAHFP